MSAGGGMLSGEDPRLSADENASCADYAGTGFTRATRFREKI